MLTMLCDHISTKPDDIYTIIGNIAMPIYIYRQVGSKDLMLLLGVAVASEPGFILMTGSPGNVVWLFVGAHLCCREDFKHALVGGGLLGLMVGLHPGWWVWLPLLFRRERWLWYAILGSLALVDGWPWAVGLVGYEIAWWRPWARLQPPRGLWVTFYPIHMMAVAVAKAAL